MSEATIKLKVTPLELIKLKNLLNYKVERMKKDNLTHGIEMDMDYLVLQQYIKEREKDCITV